MDRTIMHFMDNDRKWSQMKDFSFFLKRDFKTQEIRNNLPLIGFGNKCTYKVNLSEDNESNIVLKICTKKNLRVILDVETI